MQLDDHEGGGGPLANSGQPINQHPVAAIDLEGHPQQSTNFQQMSFSELCQVNQQGGDPRLYDALRSLMIGSQNQKPEDMLKAFDPELLDHLTSSSLNFSSDSDGEGSSSGPPGKKEEVNICEHDDGRLYFKGYPECDFLRQINIVLHTWNKVGHFPVNFVQMQGFTDETEACVQHLNSVTHLVFQLFDTLQQGSAEDPQDDLLLVTTLVKDFLLNVGPRGVLTMLGQRKTPGSQDIPWPSIYQLTESFNRPHTVLTEEQKQSRKNPPSKLTVGARALTKHCHRSSEGFWGQFRGTEVQKNFDANAKLDEVLSNCVWVNVHIIVHTETIVECRIEQGYGMRWTGDGKFRGFLEPQMSGGHDKGWRH